MFIEVTMTIQGAVPEGVVPPIESTYPITLNSTNIITYRPVRKDASGGWAPRTRIVYREGSDVKVLLVIEEHAEINAMLETRQCRRKAAHGQDENGERWYQR